MSMGTFISVVAIVGLLLLFAAAYGLSYLGCWGKVRDIGMPYRFELIGGCQIQEKGRWLPLQNYRVL